MDCKGKWFCEFLQTFGVILIVNLRFKFRYVKFVVEITFILLSFCFESVSFCYNVTVAPVLMSFSHKVSGLRMIRVLRFFVAFLVHL